MKKTKAPTSAARSGFSLLEMLIVLMILAILIGIVGYYAQDYLLRSSETAGKGELDHVQKAL